uniref:Rho GTPase-activating protein 26 n=1 Tax=Phallusia mammillata TaxID=59560 RepID=A0A6F9D784_9ASCI|nr:rho GTPase-activating protein 26 [Phallusia mammillata]
MVLHPLEFSECYLDSPWFRKSIQQYEEELDRTNGQIKQLIKDAKNMLNASRSQAKSMCVFNERLQNFQFDCIGENLTDDEKTIAGSLNEFGSMLNEIASQWNDTIERSEIQLIKPLELFRKNQIHSYKESKKSFDKSSERYYKQLEHTLALSHKKKDQLLVDSDNELLYLKRQFHKDGLNYVSKLQEIQERKKFEFVEHLLMFMKVYFNFFKQSHETALDCQEYIQDLQMKLIATRERYDGTRDKTQNLMRKMEENPDRNKDTGGHGVDGSRWSRAGYLFMMDKNTIRLTSKWTKYFCTYNKDNKLFQVISAFHSSFNNTSNANGGTYLEPMIVRTCTRRSTDSIDKRFCFDLEVEDTGGKVQLITFQAVSDIDRKKWMQVMDGKEPEYVQTKDFMKKEGRFKLDDTGFKFVEKVIAEIEHRGVEHEGIYRLVGVMSKVDLLLQQALDKDLCDSVDYTNDSDWEINTLTSALKSAFRNLPDPLMTFDLHRDFINAAKCENPEDRVTKVATLVQKLPASNRKVLAMLCHHLRKVEAKNQTNKMTIQNLGVCFGPTLMRERQETVQSIMELKFSNIIVEILIEEYPIVFGDEALTSESGKQKSPRAIVRSGNVSRLPSQRLKSRPKAVYELTSMPNILEKDNKSPPTTAEKPNFRRGQAFRSNGRSPSPRSKRLDLQAGGTAESSTDDDELHISPLDLSLGFDHMAIPQGDGDNPYVNVPKRPTPPIIPERASKEIWTPNGSAKVELRSNPTSPETLAPSNDPAGLTHSNQADDRRKPAGSPAAKKRFSSRKPQNEVKPVYAQVNKAQNLNNNNTATSPPPPKPKSLAVSASIVQKSRKFLASVKEGNSPTVPVKYARKMLHSPTKTKRRTNNSVLPSKSQKDVTRSPRVNRRPKSEFIPSAFLVEEPDLNSDGATSTTPPGTSNPHLTSKSRSEDNFHEKVRPRASAVLTSRESLGHISTHSPSDSDSDTDDVTSPDDVRVTNVAKTLYACQGEHDSELSFLPGQLIRDVQTSDEPGWLKGTLNSRTGLFPQNYVKFV